VRLFEILKKYSKDGRHPYHMPGHKRNTDFDYLRDLSAEIDFTEIDGLDNLHAPDGILLEAQRYAAEIYGADSSFFLVNGSTGGILSAIYSAAKGKKDILIARNCHKSVYNAVSLLNLRPFYLVPRVSEEGFFLDITQDDIKSAIEKNPSVCAVVITSPSFDGVISDISAIAEICHNNNIPLIVDAAHGAHLGFLDSDIKSPVECGADVTIMSLHKTLPSLTQTAIVHVKSSLISAEDLQAAVAVFETSSPSYIFMASIDGCVHEMQNKKMFLAWRERIKKIRQTAEKAENVHILTPNGVFAYDESKLIVTADGYSGEELSGILRKRFNIEPEMVAENYVLLMTGAGDSDEMTDALCDAIVSVPQKNGQKQRIPEVFECPQAAMTPSDAAISEKEKVSFADAAGRISADTIMCYPPGIPLLVPGEFISHELVEKITDLAEQGLNILTSRGSYDGTISVVKK